MSTPANVRPLDALRERLRRIQFVVGLGFLALIVSAPIQAALAFRLGERLEGVDSVWVEVLARTLISRLWVYAALPALCYGAARIVPLKPRSTAIGTALTGEAFYLALDVVTGELAFTVDYGLLVALRLVTLALGIFFAERAIRRGRADADAGQQQHRAAAAAKQDAYAEFAREAERLAARAPGSTPSEATPPGASGGDGSKAPPG